MVRTGKGAEGLVVQSVGRANGDGSYTLTGAEYEDLHRRVELDDPNIGLTRELIDGEVGGLEYVTVRDRFYEVEVTLRPVPQDDD